MLLIHAHWLLVFGAPALGLVVGWATYFRPAIRRSDRLIPIAIGAVVVIASVASAAAGPAGYVGLLPLVALLAIVYAGGCFVGRALRNLADFVPAMPAMTASGASTGSYLFRDAFAGTGGGTAYLRRPPAGGGVARERLTFDTGARAPAPGGYTFPKTLPFTDATVGQRTEPLTGPRPHWSWPRDGMPPAPP